jgi:hypothetical protein
MQLSCIGLPFISLFFDSGWHEMMLWDLGRSWSLNTYRWRYCSSCA